jgi:hypothetical protein
MKKYEDHLITPQQITVIFNEGHPISISNDDTRYNSLLSLLRNKQFDQITDLVDQTGKLNKYLSEYTKGKFLVRHGVIIIDEEPLPDTLSDKLLELTDANEDTLPLEKFWQNLRKNPSKESVKDLFAFLRANKIPITSSGCFIAYKKVRTDYKDCHSGKICNKPGRIVKMLREQVNADRNVTCSYGLHVAAYSYASNFSSGVLLEVEVNPRDVVAVPPDYKQQKMRVCRYRVIRRATHEIKDLIYRREPRRTQFEELGDASEIAI